MNLVCAGNKVFVVYQAEGGFNPDPLRTPLVAEPMFGDCKPGECDFPFFLFIQNPGHTPISIISVTKLTGICFNQLLSSAFGDDCNCGYFRLTASQLPLTCVQFPCAIGSG